MKYHIIAGSILSLNIEAIQHKIFKLVIIDTIEEIHHKSAM